MRGFVGLLCVVLALFGGTVFAVLNGPASDPPDLLAEHDGQSLLEECSGSDLSSLEKRLQVAQCLSQQQNRLLEQINQERQRIKATIAERMVEYETARANLLLKAHERRFNVKTIRLLKTHEL